ncbi:MAG: response regulator [Novosphingobium sp.]|nr:response regulator [Novosphingobium sp.]
MRNSLANGDIVTNEAPLARVEGDALIVEDNVLIAMDSENILRELGIERCHIAVSVSEALKVISASPITFALLDICLRDETCEEIATTLEGEGIPFVFASGYDDLSLLSRDFGAVPSIAKPFSTREVRAAIAKLGFV